MRSLVAVDVQARIVAVADTSSSNTILAIRSRLITFDSTDSASSGWRCYSTLRNLDKWSTYRHVPHAFLLYLAPTLRRRLVLTSMATPDRHVFREEAEVFLSGRTVLEHG